MVSSRPRQTWQMHCRHNLNVGSSTLVQEKVAGTFLHKANNGSYENCDMPNILHGRLIRLCTSSDVAYTPTLGEIQR